ncbi:TPR-like protein [Pleurostoma richardsiae]|uniref:TPR-like protein n=1 Tax=Pleurostoma richardsiae TaxID=41990 RepID=A0AA38RTZ3_9PEZI|nr:TPR-like protein [Pleurostoma richardsiae]
MHIQEIIDNAGSLKLSDDKKAQDGGDSEALPFIPELPPQLALNSGKTAEEIMADLNKSPLFMTELEENDDVAALQALAYEGTPLENSSDFKERGNECFREKRWADAKEFYTKGVLILISEQQRRTLGEPPREGDSDAPEEVAAQRAVLEQLYINRAACHLELRNYRSCWLDCGAALRLNPRNVKAYYRSGKALLAVGRIEEADDACARGLAVDEKNGALRALARDIIAESEKAAARAKVEGARLAKEKRRAVLLKAALKARGIRTRRTEQPPEMEDAKTQLVPDPDDPTSSLSFPAVLLYPAHLQSDFIKSFNETESLEQHLGYIFPLPWDEAGEYSTSGVECYMETVTGGLVKVGKKVPLLKVLSTGNVEVLDEVVRIFVVPRAKAEAWVKEFKAKKAAEKNEKP